MLEGDDVFGTFLAKPHPNSSLSDVVMVYEIFLYGNTTNSIASKEAGFGTI